jgi:hypothetical protein
MTFRRISNEEALEAVLEEVDDEGMAEGFAQNIRNGHMIAGRTIDGQLVFRLTEEGKRYVENMGREDDGDQP